MTTNYDGGRTAHSQFKIVVSDDPSRPNDKGSCDIDFGEPQAEFLRNVQLIVWDEVLNSHRKDIDAVNLMLQQLMGSTEPFGGKVVVFGGDFRQIPPVMPGADEVGVCAATFQASALYKRFRQVELQRPVRDADDPEYSAFVDSVGDGTAQAFPGHDGSGDLIKVPAFVPHTTDCDDLIRFVYPDLRALCSTPHMYAGHAIMCTTNARVNEFNDAIVDAMDPANVATLRSYDRIDTNEAGADLHGEVLDMLGHRPGVPPHTLRLFPGAMCMIMRNMDVKRRLVNSTKCVVESIDRNVVAVRLVGAPHTGDPILVPRICFKQRLNRYDQRSPDVTRMQFPLQLCYAITLNKSQGQTLKCVGLDLRDDSFSHGHTYVGFGRVRDRGSIMILVRDHRVNGANEAFVVNVVYGTLMPNL